MLGPFWRKPRHQFDQAQDDGEEPAPPKPRQNVVNPRLSAVIPGSQRCQWKWYPRAVEQARGKKSLTGTSGTKPNPKQNTSIFEERGGSTMLSSFLGNAYTH